MSTRDEALAQIAALAEQHALTLEDLRGVLASQPAVPKPPRQGMLARVFAYLGGTLVLAGLCVLVATLWGDMGALERVIVTLGSGLVALVLSYMASLYPGRERLVTPLFLVAALVEPIGIVVVLQEFSSGGNEALGALVVAGVMAGQCAAFFARVRRSSVLFAMLAFGGVALSAALALVGIEDEFNVLVVGISYFLVTIAIARTAHEPITPLWFFLSSGMILAAWFSMVEGSIGELSEVALVGGCIYLSTVLRSRTLLATGTIALLVYTGYFSGRHFADSVGWPLLLILLGGLMMGIGTAALRIHRRFIKPAAE